MEQKDIIVRLHQIGTKGMNQEYEAVLSPMLYTQNFYFSVHHLLQMRAGREKVTFKQAFFSSFMVAAHKFCSIFFPSDFSQHTQGMDIVMSLIQKNKCMKWEERLPQKQI